MTVMERKAEETASGAMPGCDSGSIYFLQKPEEKDETENVDREHLEICAHYTVEKYDVHETWNNVKKENVYLEIMSIRISICLNKEIDNT